MTNRHLGNMALFLIAAGAGPAVLMGCGGGGGGGSSVTAVSRFAGTYTGTAEVTSGPHTGQKAPFNIVVSNAGSLTTSSTLSNGVVAAITGYVNEGTGNFTLTGTYNNAVVASGSGQLVQQGTAVSGSGIFHGINGDGGIVTVSRNNP